MCRGSLGQADVRVRTSWVLMRHLRLRWRCRQPLGHHSAEHVERVVTGLGRQFSPEPVQADPASRAGGRWGGTDRSLSRCMAIAPGFRAGGGGPTGPVRAAPPRPLWGGPRDGHKLNLEVQSAWQTSTPQRSRYRSTTCRSESVAASSAEVTRYTG